MDFGWLGKGVWPGGALEGCLRKDGNALFLDCYHYFVFCLSFFSKSSFNRFVVVITPFISRTAQDFGDHFSIISRMVRIPDIRFDHSQKSRGFGDHSYITTRIVEDSRHRTHTGGKDIWLDLLHHKQHNIYDSRIRRFGGSRSKIANVG